MALALPLAAQDLIVPKSGAPITAYNVDASGTFVYYNASADANGQLMRIAKDSVLMVRMADGTVLELGAAAPAQTAPATPAKPTTNYPEIAEEDIHGSLIAKGNKVFIPTNSTNEAERIGQERLKERVQIWGYWTVVDKPEQAHFILQYVLTSAGHDFAHLLIRPRKYYNSRPYIDDFGGKSVIKDAGARVCWMRSNDSDPAMNSTIADIFFNHIKGIITDPDYDNKVSKEYKMANKYFHKFLMKYLDADSKSNTMYYRGDYGGGML